MATRLFDLEFIGYDHEVWKCTSEIKAHNFDTGVAGRGRGAAAARAQLILQIFELVLVCVVKEGKKLVCVEKLSISREDQRKVFKVGQSSRAGRLYIDIVCACMHDHEVRFNVRVCVTI